MMNVNTYIAYIKNIKIIINNYLIGKLNKKAEWILLYCLGVVI